MKSIDLEDIGFWLGDESSLPMLTGGLERVRVFPYFSSTLIALQLEPRSCDCQQLGFDFSFHHFSGLFAKYPSRCIDGYLSNQGQNQSSIFPPPRIAWSFYDQRIGVVSTVTKLDKLIVWTVRQHVLQAHEVSGSWHWPTSASADLHLQ